MILLSIKIRIRFGTDNVIWHFLRRNLINSNGFWRLPCTFIADIFVLFRCDFGAYGFHRKREISNFLLERRNSTPTNSISSSTTTLGNFGVLLSMVRWNLFVSQRKLWGHFHLPGFEQVRRYRRFLKMAPNSDSVLENFDSNQNNQSASTDSKSDVSKRKEKFRG